MKNLIVSTEGKDPHTTFLNTDEKLKKEIADFKLDNVPKILYGEWTIDEWEEKEVKCISGRDIKYVSREKVEKELEDILEYERNQKFQPTDHFKNVFGVLSYSFSHTIDLSHGCLRMRNGNSITEPKLETLTVKKLDVDGFISIGDEVDKYNPLDINWLTSAYEVSISYYHAIVVQVAKYNSTGMGLHFDKNGDFVNRDYNIKLQEYVQQDIPLITVLEQWETIMRAALPETLMKSKNKYFTDDVCLIPTQTDDRNEYEFGVTVHPAIGDDKYQIDSGYKIHKKPKRLVEVSIDELIQEVKDSIPKGAMDILNHGG